MGSSEKSPWPALLQYLMNVAFVIGFGWLCEKVSFYFYPLALFLIGSRVQALSLVGHEGVHQLIFNNKKMNIIFARYFCYFPSFISYTYYSRLHLLHHRFLGTVQDPDAYLFTVWQSKTQWFFIHARTLFTGRALISFAEYFNGLPQLLKNKVLFRGESDYFQMGVFWIFAATLLSFFGGWKLFFLYWVLPLYCWLPWLQLINQLHHSGTSLMPNEKARNLILKYSFLEQIFFPLNINFHETHHRDASIPFYRLRQQSKNEARVSYLVSDIAPVIFSGPV